MGERCRCGAELLSGLHFCVGCGAELAPAGRPLPPAHGPIASGPAPWAGRPIAHGASPSFAIPRQAPAPLAPAPWTPAPRPVATPWPAVTIAPAAMAPAPNVRPWSPGPWLVALSVALVVLLSAGAVLVTLRPALVFGEPTPTVSSASAAPNAQPFMPAAAPAAGDELRDQVDQDRSRVESTTGWWVPQLSSKKSGTVDGGVRYDDETILGHYRGLAAQYPGAALLYSGDWPVFKKGDYWVVVVAQPFATPAQANAWCDEQGFGADDCFAKSLSHSGGPTGTTVHR